MTNKHSEWVSVDEYNRRNKILHELHIKYGYLKGQRPRNSKYKRMIVYKEKNGVCEYCGKSLSKDEFHLEHKIPISRGGNNEYDNLTISCASCNLKKGSKTMSEFLNEI